MIPHSQPWVIEEDISYLSAIIKNKMLSKGTLSIQLEERLSAFLNKKYALMTGNGTQAQMLLLKVLGIGKGDEVIFPSYVCDKVLKGVLAVGATPVLCDIGENWVMNTETISDKISDKTKAIILVHIFGINAYNESLKSLGVPIIEDICQSFGKTIKGNVSGSNSDFAFTSFHGTKMIGAGEGGMLFMNNDSLYEQALKIKYQDGFFTSGTDLVSAFALAQFDRIDQNLRRRKEIAEKYNKTLPATLTKEMRNNDLDTTFFRYVLESTKDFNQIRNSFESKGIAVRKGVDNLIHRSLGLDNKYFLLTERKFQEAVSIPILPQMTEEEVDLVIEAVNELYIKQVL